MCEDCTGPAVSRRRFGLLGLAAGATGLTAAATLGTAPAAGSATRIVQRAGAAAMPAIRPRDTWGAGLPPTGPLEAEAPGDVRFLLLHHTVGPNEYSADSVPNMIRSIFRMHTDGERNWPDVAYNFLVDRHGTIWEARQGSIDAPIKGSATGGSQGFALLCCFLGTHTDTPPTDAAQIAMVALLAWLADRYGIDTAPGATATFTSRGSNLHPAGSVVTTPTIAGHRDMSATECPGDAAYALVRDAFPAAVTNLRAAATTTIAAPPPTDPVDTSDPEPAPPTTDPPAPDHPANAAAPTTTAGAVTPTEPPTSTEPPSTSGEGGTDAPVEWIAGGVAGVAGLIGAGWYAARRRQNRQAADPADPDEDPFVD